MNTINNFFRGKHISDINQFGRVVGIISALIGVGILTAHSITKDFTYRYSGFVYLFIAFAVNITLVLMLLISLFTNKEKENNTSAVFLTIGFMLLNIPLAILCVALGE